MPKATAAKAPCLTRPADVNEYIDALRASPRMGDQVAHHSVLPARPARLAPAPDSGNGATAAVFGALGIERLYRHQAEAIDAIRAGRHVVVATPTASGKTLIYNLPVFEQVARDPAARALYLFPLKALAQDQLTTLRSMAAAVTGTGPTSAVYDGDTSTWHRRKIRETPPNVLLTNPEMLHLSLLPYHEKWRVFLEHLSVVVVDEVHTYRGLMGSHMAQVFRRFIRICAYYGAFPTFVFSSATVGNPAELAEGLTGLSVSAITRSGAPRGRRHVVFMDPLSGPAQTAILLLKAALHRGLRTIVYTQSRKLTELLALWAGSRAGRFADKIAAYRAGFLPEARREIEAKLSSGELLAVISTSALELGIDVGDLDLCLLVGYPGTLVATWQRGGRVGRGGQDSAVVLLAGDDALDQYLLRHPETLIDGAPETAVVNPDNDLILKKHLVCAAAELILKADEPLVTDRPAVRRAVAELERAGELMRSADGSRLFARRKAPHRDINLRGAGKRLTIVSADTGVQIGEIDDFRADREAHPGAVYLHMGETYQVEALDRSARTVRVRRAVLDYYTRVRGHKDTEILQTYDCIPVWGTQICIGRLKVTDQVTGYERIRIRGGKKINIIPLDLPPRVFETEGLWILIPPAVQTAADDARHHFMGGIHAVEHAAIGIFPLLVMADRNDLGGISTPFHPQTGQPAVFVYDGVPGGAGLTRGAFGKATALLETVRQVIRACPCKNGCPACVHSPKCGSGNRPIDKAAAGFILDQLRDAEAMAVPAPAPVTPPAAPAPRAVAARHPVRPARYGVLDIETQRSAEEVGGWHRADRMQVSCAVLYDAETDRFVEFLEAGVSDLIAHLHRLDLVIGFNIKRFDYQVLKGYSDTDFTRIPTLDILEVAKNHLGFRLSLDHLANVTLGAEKSADGLQALKWWKEGRIREIIDYCRKDVAITHDLYRFGRDNGYLLFRNKAGQTVRLPVGWGAEQ